MNARLAKLGALGASLGLVVALVAGSGAMAASHGGGNGKKQPPAPAASYSCATFAGLVSSQSSVAYNGVALKAGQTITTTASPAAAGDQIELVWSIGLSITFATAPATGMTFRAPADAVYNLSWSFLPAGTRPSNLTWTFNCS